MNKNREEFIQKRVQEHYDEIKDKYEVVGVFLQGSQNYELDVYDEEYKSDVDTKAIIVPSFKDIVYNREPKSFTYIFDNNEHCDIKDIRVMFDTFKKQNVNFLEILFTKFKIINPKYEKLIKSLFVNRELIAHYDINKALNCQCGMSEQKYVALEHPYPTIKDKIDKYGYDGKQLHHIARMNDFIKRYSAGESFESCLIPNNKEWLIELKKNKLPLEEARKLAKELNEETYRIAKENISDDNKIALEVIEELDNIKYKVLEQRLKEELLETNNDKTK